MTAPARAVRPRRGWKAPGPGHFVVALVPARDEQASVAATVKTLLGLEAVGEVWVLADGCSDRTAEEARAAGAGVLASRAGVGKGGAVDRALDLVPAAGVYLLVDADLADTAGEAQALLDPVLMGEFDAAIGRFPPTSGGGFGLVKRVARAGIRALTGFDAREPLSGQRAVSREALLACRPLARGFGLETGMTIDLVRLGFRVAEVPVEMAHRATGRDAAGFAHRARQGVDVLAALVPRALRLR